MPISRAAVPVSLVLSNGHADLPPLNQTLTLYGPGDIRGFDARACVRTWPQAQVCNAETSAFALVEFGDADFPWRYTPVSATAGKLQPWLSLIVLKDDGSEYTLSPSSAQVPFPIVHVLPKFLPKLSEAWAWAHTQAVGDASDVSTRLSRILSGRVLAPLTAYSAFLVPTFNQGRLTGIGQPSSDPGSDLLALSWPDPSPSDLTPVSIPVYFSWKFQTGDLGDFASLVRRLKSRVLPAEISFRELNASQASKDLPPAATENLPMAGALITPAARQTRSLWRMAQRSEGATVCHCIEQVAQFAFGTAKAADTTIYDKASRRAAVVCVLASRSIRTDLRAEPKLVLAAERRSTVARCRRSWRAGR